MGTGRNKFNYEGETGAHHWYDGTPRPWEFKRVWHLEPSLTDPETVYAGAEDAAMFRSTDGGQNWQELAGLRGHKSAPQWQPGAGGMCCTRSSWIRRTRSECTLQFRPPEHFAPMTADRPGAHQPGPSFRGHSRSRRGSRPLRPPHRHAPIATRRSVHAKALGCHA